MSEQIDRAHTDVEDAVGVLAAAIYRLNVVAGPRVAAISARSAADTFRAAALNFDRERG